MCVRLNDSAVFLTLALLGNMFCAADSAEGVVPEITGLVVNDDEIPRYEKFEISFQVSGWLDWIHCQLQKQHSEPCTYFKGFHERLYFFDCPINMSDGQNCRNQNKPLKNYRLRSGCATCQVTHQTDSARSYA